MIRIRKCESKELKGDDENGCSSKGAFKIIHKFIKQQIYEQFQKTANIWMNAFFVLKGGELVDNEINSQIKCNPVLKGCSVRRIP